MTSQIRLRRHFEDRRTDRRALHRRDKPVTAPAGHCLDIAWLVRRIAERLPELIDCRVQAMFEVARSSSGP